MCRSWACGCEFLATRESTGGAYTEVDVIGRPKGFIRAAHVHVGVTEHYTVLEGAMRIKLHGKTYVLRARRRDHDPARHAAHAAAGRQRRRPRPRSG